VLTIDNIMQIFDEHEVFAHDPGAAEQRLPEVLLTMGEHRADCLTRASRVEDGVFSAWAICLPFFRQRPAYTQLMQERRRMWFPPELSSPERAHRARNFFSDSLLRMDLDQLGELVNAPGADERIGTYLGSLQELGPEATA
jgi:hypothetical protein